MQWQQEDTDIRMYNEVVKNLTGEAGRELITKLKRKNVPFGIVVNTMTILLENFTFFHHSGKDCNIFLSTFWKIVEERPELSRKEKQLYEGNEGFHNAILGMLSGPYPDEKDIFKVQKIVAYFFDNQCLNVAYLCKESPLVPILISLGLPKQAIAVCYNSWNPWVHQFIEPKQVLEMLLAMHYYLSAQYYIAHPGFECFARDPYYNRTLDMFCEYLPEKNQKITYQDAPNELSSLQYLTMIGAQLIYKVTVNQNLNEKRKANIVNRIEQRIIDEQTRLETLMELDGQEYDNEMEKCRQLMSRFPSQMRLRPSKKQ